MSGAVILMYHVVDEARSAAERQWCCSPASFEQQMRWLRNNCNVVTLDEVVDFVRSGRSVPAGTVAVTFDDGTRCLLERALPILARHDVPATAFVVSGLLGRDNEWLVEQGWSRRQLLSDTDLMLLQREGIQIGSHSATHADLAVAGPEQTSVEVRRSKAQLEAVVGAPVKHFAYPFGRVRKDTADAVSNAGYLSASTVRAGWNTSKTDPMLLRRVEVFNWDSPREFALKVRFAMDHVRLNGQAVRGMAARALESIGLRASNRFSN